MPLGDATCVVYLSPIFTAAFAWWLLGEKPPIVVFPTCVLLSIAGTLLVTQTSQRASNTSDQRLSIDGSGGYSYGVVLALCSAVAAGLLPALTRRMQQAFWATVELWSAIGASFIFTPLALI
eukprot:SAG31_NODE_18051_length_648_cov_1.224044_2_plen_121_part_01